jgi:endonuclease YncB( thermonuclease family)
MRTPSRRATAWFLARGSHLRTSAVRQFGMRPSTGTAALLVALVAAAGCAPVVAPRPPEGPSRPPTAAPRPPISPLEGAAAVVGVASVIDGDTIEIHGQRIRLHGIDAPEASQPCDLDGKPWRCGQASANALAEYIGRRTVTCEPRDRDRYGRLVAACSVGGVSLSAWMVREGWAVAYRKYSQDFVADEAAAQASRRGIWRSVFIVPWEWRAQRRAGGAAASGPLGSPATAENHRSGCDIKGNINSKGERIYHVPGGRYYANTIVESARGERWFCSEAEAQAAGWRPPKQ